MTVISNGGAERQAQPGGTLDENSFDKPVGFRDDLDQMEQSSEMMKASHDSFAQFVASGDFMFDT